MKLEDIRDLSKEDILGALGLASKPSVTERLLGSLSIFGVGLLVGAGTALLLAPKSGQGLREDLSQRFRDLREGIGADGQNDRTVGESTGRDEART